MEKNSQGLYNISKEDVFVEKVNVPLSPEKRPVGDFLSDETWLEATRNVEYVKKRYIDKFPPEYATFARQLAETDEDYYKDNELETAIAYVFSHIGRMIYAEQSLPRIREQLRLIRADRRVNRGTQSFTKNENEQLLVKEARDLVYVCAAWPQAVHKMIYYLTNLEGGLEKIKEFWRLWESLARRPIGEKTTTGRNNILGNLALAHVLDRLNIDMYFPPVEIDTDHETDMLAVSREDQELLYFVQLKAHGAGTFVVDQEVVHQHDDRDRSQKDLFLDYCAGYAKMWKFGQYAPRWVVMNGVNNPDQQGVSNLTGKPQSLDANFLSATKARIVETGGIRRAA